MSSTGADDMMEYIQYASPWVDVVTCQISTNMPNSSFRGDRITFEVGAYCLEKVFQHSVSVGIVQTVPPLQAMHVMAKAGALVSMFLTGENLYYRLKRDIYFTKVRHVPDGAIAGWNYYRADASVSEDGKEKSISFMFVSRPAYPPDWCLVEPIL